MPECQRHRRPTANKKRSLSSLPSMPECQRPTTNKKRSLSSLPSMPERQRHRRPTANKKRSLLSEDPQQTRREVCYRSHPCQNASDTEDPQQIRREVMLTVDESVSSRIYRSS